MRHMYIKSKRINERLTARGANECVGVQQATVTRAPECWDEEVVCAAGR